MNSPSSDSPPHLRPIRSYVLREGRLTRGQQKALDNLWPTFGLDLHDTTPKPLDLPAVFGRTSDVTVEIGFGDGGALLHMAQMSPENDFIGVEVHRRGVGRLLLNIQQAGLQNVRVFCADGIDVLSQAIAAETIAAVNRYFPDPWRKKKHNKRRIVQPPFIDLVHSRLQRGGIFHFATDWEPYAEDAMEKLQAYDGLQNLAGTNAYSPRPDSRPETKFERRGQRLGHGVFDILMTKAD